MGWRVSPAGFSSARRPRVTSRKPLSLNVLTCVDVDLIYAGILASATPVHGDFHVPFDLDLPCGRRSDCVRRCRVGTAAAGRTSIIGCGAARRDGEYDGRSEPRGATVLRAWTERDGWCAARVHRPAHVGSVPGSGLVPRAEIQVDI